MAQHSEANRISTRMKKAYSTGLSKIFPQKTFTLLEIYQNILSKIFSEIVDSDTVVSYNFGFIERQYLSSAYIFDD